MTVPEGKRTKSKLDFHTKAIELAVYTKQICNNNNIFPKRDRWILANRLVVRTVLKPNIKKYRMKLYKYHKLHRTGRMTKDKMDVCYIAWKAHLAKGDNYKTIRSMDSYYNSLWEARHVQKIVG